MNTEKSGKPKWQRRLERESWQAELIISGAAIFGASLLPQFLERFQVWLLLNLDDHTLQVWETIIIYFSAATTLMILVFVFHFVVRALWIGMVGLNSVFPGGIRRVERYSEYFQARMKEDIGDIDAFISRLDRLGSGVFGAGFTMVSLFLNLGLIGALFALLYRLGYLAGVPVGTLDTIGYLLVGAFFLTAIVSSYLGGKRFHDNDNISEWHYRTNKLSTWMFLVNRRFTLVGMTLLSYTFIDRKGYFGYIVLGIVATVIMLSIADGSDRHRDMFSHRRYYQSGADSTLVCRCNYADSDFDGLYYSPVIPSEEMGVDDMLRIFVPLPEREWDYLMEGCTTEQAASDLPREERKVINQQRRLSCMDEYITLHLNGQVIRQDDLRRTWRTTSAATQFGAELTLVDPPYRRGKNMLEVTTQFPLRDSDLTPRTTNVPFYVK